MNERTTLEIIAPTVEEALAQGLTQLGLPADAVSVEVLDSGNKGLFGLGGRQVRVRLTVNGLDGAPASKTEPTPASKPDTVRLVSQKKPSLPPLLHLRRRKRPKRLSKTKLKSQLWLKPRVPLPKLSLVPGMMKFSIRPKR